jgi:hypothetical protein
MARLKRPKKLKIVRASPGLYGGLEERPSPQTLAQALMPDEGPESGLHRFLNNKVMRAVADRLDPIKFGETNTTKNQKGEPKP